MAKTWGEGRRNVRELIEFFEDFEKISNVVVDAFIERHKRKKCLRQTLKRFKERGLIAKSEGFYKITKKGVIFFLRYRKLNKQDDTRKWDGKWRLISFDVPTKNNKERNILRRALQENNFYQLHQSAWIAPHEMTKEFWRFVVLNGLNKYCKIMLIEVLDGDEEIKKHFKLI